MIKIKKINKYFNRKKQNEIHVINNTSLELPNKGIVTFFGSSGCGKTTLLNVIGGLDSFKGEISYDDQTFKSYNMKKVDRFRLHHFGYVFQNFNLLENETVYDNLKIALEMIDIYDKDEIDKRITRALSAVGMYKYRKKRAYALSGGQKQRVAIARALIKNCKVLLCDEPTGNLDTKNTIQIMKILKKISTESLVLLVTHEMNIAQYYSDFIVSLKDGEVVEVLKNNAKENINIEDDNAFYLQDMKKEDYHFEDKKIEVYKEDDSLEIGDISLFIKDNTIYVKSKKIIQVLPDKIRIIDDHKKQTVTKEDMEEVDYDTSDFVTPKKKANLFKRFLNSLAYSLVTFSIKKRKTMFMRISLILIGFLFACSAYSLSWTSFDMNTMGHDENVNLVSVKRNATIQSAALLKELYAQEAITFPFNVSDVMFELSYNIDHCLMSNSFIYPIMFNYDDSIVISKGNKPVSDYDLVLSESMITQINKNNSLFSISGQDLLGKQFYSSFLDKYFTVCGITNSGYNSAYIRNMDNSLSMKYGMPTSYNSEISYSTYFKKFYEITEGNDVNLSDNKKECIVKEGYNYQIGDRIKIFNEEMEIVGKYRLSYDDIEVKFLIDDATLLPIYSEKEDDIIGIYSSTYNCNCFDLLSGELPKEGECLVPFTSSIKIGDTIKVEYYNFLEMKVVGTYASSFRNMSKGVVISDNDYIDQIAKNYYGGCFYLKDRQKALDIASSIEYEDCNILTMKEYINQEIQSEILVIKSSFFIAFFILLIIAFILIYFLMRSRMLSEIYSIGVRRELGEKRINIFGRHLLDSMVVNLLTVILGFIIASIFLTSKFSSISSLLGINFNLLFYIGFGLMIYLLCSFIGTIPIMVLLRHTPSEIAHKYDI
ncbi:MAG: ATP-binding cassette domain-containing protein [Bacillales bacterium]|nr:ATP-binding cassette domain-containing protein [Bacillales bacterium]